MSKQLIFTKFDATKCVSIYVKLKLCVFLFLKKGPVVTDNGNFILDWKFKEKADWKLIDQKITCFPGNFVMAGFNEIVTVILTKGCVFRECLAAPKVLNIRKYLK